MSVLRKLFQPKIVIPAVLSLALIGALLGVSDIGKVVAAMQALQAGHALLFVGMMVVYEVVRGAQWHTLLRGLGIHVPRQAEIFSFLMGEATKSAPIGNYFQNYVLTRVEGEDFGRTSAATTLIVLTEVAWCLVAVVVIGIDDWTWLRPLIVIGLAVFVAAVLIFRRVYAGAEPPRWLTRHAAMRTFLDELERFGRGFKALEQPRVLATEAALSGVYLLVAAGALYVAAMGLGIHNLSFWQLIGVYAFSLAVSLIMPLPIDLGVLEVSGAGALVAYGVSREVAVSVMLINRLLSIGAAILVAAIGTIFLRDELRQALRGRQPRPSNMAEQTAS